jgi:hypothetical protein
MIAIEVKYCEYFEK